MNRTEKLQRRRKTNAIILSVGAGIGLLLGAVAVVGDGGTHGTPTTTAPVVRGTSATTLSSTTTAYFATLRDRETDRANRWNGRDLDCDDFAVDSIVIEGSDPNNLDADGNGIACEVE